jgi:hypothetical protein
LGLRGKWQEAGEDSIMMDFINFYTSSNIIEEIKSRRV